MNKHWKPNDAERKLGKLPAKIDPRTFKLSKYLTDALPLPPRRRDWLSPVKSWPMFWNDKLGSCGPAAVAHIMEISAAATGKPFSISDADVLKCYEDVSGYVPGDPNTDTGVILLDLLNYVRQVGIGGHKIVAFVKFDWLNDVEARQVVDLFGAALYGVGLPISAQTPTVKGGQPCWDVPDYGAIGYGSPGSWGGHAYPVGQYSYRPGWWRGENIVTWAMVYKQTKAFRRTYTDEAYAILTQDWLDADQKSPSGFDSYTLLQDLTAIQHT